MSLTRLARALPRNLAGARSFSITTARMAEGDAGATRSGGAAQSDSFTKREKANEDHYVKNQEREKLAALKKKVADQEAQLAKDREDIEKMQGSKK